MNTSDSKGASAALDPSAKLPHSNTVFFGHYQRKDFEKGNEILSMNVYDQQRCILFPGDEAAMIEGYCRKVRELRERGLQLVHWNQDAPHYGPDHITGRYFEITGKTIELDYGQSLNLSEFLIEKYGEDYADHYRLDYLADVNHFLGHSLRDGKKKIYSSLRLMLLVKIYKNELRGTLITRKTLQSVPENPSSRNRKIGKEHKTFPEHFNHNQQDRLADALRAIFRKDKPMTLVLLVYCLQHEYETPLLIINHGELKWFHAAMQEYFGNQNIGARQLYFPKPGTIRESHQLEILNVRARIDAILQAIEG